MEKITISKELSNYIESLHYETNALQDLLNRMDLETTEESLREYWYDKYIEKYESYNIAKQELENEYITPKFGNNYKWHLDFNTCIVEVEVNK